MSRTAQFFKFIPGPGESIGGEGIDWSLFLPKEGPGSWVPAAHGELVCGENGYHVCRRHRHDILVLWGKHLYVAEVRGEEIVECDHAAVARQLRLTEKVTTWNHRNACLLAQLAIERAASC